MKRAPINGNLVWLNANQTPPGAPPSLTFDRLRATSGPGKNEREILDCDHKNRYNQAKS